MKNIILISLAFLVSCKSRETKISSSEKVHLLYIDTSKYALFNFSYKNDSAFFDNTHKAATLTADDIDQIEKLIKIKVDSSNRHSNSIYFINNSARYFKQFITTINSKGEKEVWVNCFCDLVFAHDWKNQIVSVMDGGSCFFQFKVNLTKGIIYDFAINGVA